ncbi:hypothetical protein [Marivivens aquimaris]|uniref:hypothetical protein n=1 Tax=Marivivens aquimaris TaxID=2774876 RepID=UPI00187E2B38|nr:hypothetical protein [Marivivens aquimaris]
MKILYNYATILNYGGFCSQTAAIAMARDQIGADFDPNLVSREAVTSVEAKLLVREAIGEIAGDQQSLLGTTSDAIGLLFFEVAKFAIAMKDQNSLADIRSAATPLADMMAPVIARVEAGDTLLTHQVKGEANVIEEMEQRATQVATVLQSVQSA